jgi:hypothetical protein
MSIIRPRAYVPVAGSRRLTVSSVLALTALIGGCAAGASEPVGAQPPTALVGATPVVTPTLPNLAARTTRVYGNPPVVATRLQPLVDSITSAIAGEKRVPADVKVSQKAAAGEQVLVSWVVSIDPNDADARRNVRTDAVKIMQLVKASNVEYGSVLLVATGSVLDNNKKKFTNVVRAKFTQSLVRATDWASVQPEIIFTLCDDKPAEIAPSFT